MRWDKIGAGTVFAAVMVALLAPPERRSGMHWNGTEREQRGYYGYQDITEQGYEPVSYNITNVVKQRRWPSVALVVPLAWALVVVIIVTLLVLL
jgi:hypothetical protein